MSQTAATSPESVLDILRPLRGAYTGRASQGRDAGDADRRAAPLVGDSNLAPVAVEAVLTIDREGRIPWRFRLPEMSADCVKLGLSSEGAGILIRPADTDGAAVHRPDRQGRLHIPHGLLRAIGGKPGGRFALVRPSTSNALALVPVSRLGLRPANDATRG